MQASVDNDPASSDDEEIDDAIAHRLQTDAKKARGQYERKVADKIRAAIDRQQSREDADLREPIRNAAPVQIMRGHNKSVTCLCISPDGEFAFTGGKDCCIVRWDLISGHKQIFKGSYKQPDTITSGGHSDHVMALACRSSNSIHS